MLRCITYHNNYKFCLFWPRGGIFEILKIFLNVLEIFEIEFPRSSTFLLSLLDSSVIARICQIMWKIHRLRISENLLKFEKIQSLKTGKNYIQASFHILKIYDQNGRFSFECFCLVLNWWSTLHISVCLNEKDSNL